MHNVLDFPIVRDYAQNAHYELIMMQLDLRNLATCLIFVMNKVGYDHGSRGLHRNHLTTLNCLGGCNIKLIYAYDGSHIFTIARLVFTFIIVDIYF